MKKITLTLIALVVVSRGVDCLKIKLQDALQADLLRVDLLAVAVMGLAIYPLLLATLSRVKVTDVFRAMVRPQVIAFSTASSMATLPVTMGACAKLGISRQTAGFVVPLGATINMTGNAIYYTRCPLLRPILRH